MAYVGTAPARVSVSLTWEPTSLAARAQAVHTAETVLALPSGSESPPELPTTERGRREQGEDLPPALAAMIREQREDEAARAPKDAPPGPQGISATIWRAIDQRARSLGIEARLSDEGRCLDLTVSLTA